MRDRGEKLILHSIGILGLGSGHLFTSQQLFANFELLLNLVMKPGTFDEIRSHPGVTDPSCAFRARPVDAGPENKLKALR